MPFGVAKLLLLLSCWVVDENMNLQVMESLQMLLIPPRQQFYGVEVSNNAVNSIRGTRENNISNVLWYSAGVEFLFFAWVLYRLMELLIFVILHLDSFYV